MTAHAVTTKHAVVIAGAGPTRLMLAGELALAGVGVAIVERRRHSSALAPTASLRAHLKCLTIAALLIAFSSKDRRRKSQDLPSLV